MTLDSESREVLIKYRLEQAKETIEDARLLIENNKLRSAVNRIYYGMFYSLLSLGLLHSFETGKHSKLIGLIKNLSMEEFLIKNSEGLLTQHI